MTSYLDKLNLRPSERRLVVVIALVVITVLYFWFVWPQFAEWNKLQRRKSDIEMNRQRFQREIDRTTTYQAELRKLKEKGEVVDSEGQALNMQRTVNSVAAVNAVQVTSYTPGKGAVSSGGKTNLFFEEQTGNIAFVTEESSLVNFLYALSSGQSLIRVSSMTLNPDPARMKLMGNMTLVASYPKRPPAKTTAKPGSPPGAPTAPSAATAKTPGASGAPKSISAALSAAQKPATNAPPAPSWWDKTKSFFTKSSSAPAKAPAPATNAPAPKK